MALVAEGEAISQKIQADQLSFLSRTQADQSSIDPAVRTLIAAIWARRRSIMDRELGSLLDQ